MDTPNGKKPNSEKAAESLAIALHYAPKEVIAFALLSACERVVAAFLKEHPDKEGKYEDLVTSCVGLALLDGRQESERLERSKAPTVDADADPITTANDAEKEAALITVGAALRKAADRGEARKGGDSV